jgi:hypothetical protein
MQFSGQSGHDRFQSGPQKFQKEPRKALKAQNRILLLMCLLCLFVAILYSYLEEFRPELASHEDSISAGVIRDAVENIDRLLPILRLEKTRKVNPGGYSPDSVSMRAIRSV